MSLITSFNRWWTPWRTMTITTTILWYRQALLYFGFSKRKIIKVWKPQEKEEGKAKQPKNYYWSREERHGVVHNTLKYSRRPQLQASQTTNPKPDQPSASEIWQNNCCTFLLIFIILVLSVLLMLAVLRCYHLGQPPRNNIHNKSASYSRNTVLPTEKSFTFFPFWYKPIYQCLL